MLFRSFSSTWFYWVVGLICFIGLCWLPVLNIQYKLRKHAKACVTLNTITPEFKKLMQIWTALGIPAFIAILVIFWLMVIKPLAMY